MTKRYYRRWNWEFDFGEQRLPSPPPAGSVYAIAYYDGEGRLYRAESIEQIGVDRPHIVRFVYDYFCDDANRVMEKRSLDENGRVLVLVRFVYGTDLSAPTQIAYAPDSGQTRSAVWKDYMRRRSAAQSEDSGGVSSP